MAVEVTGQLDSSINNCTWVEGVFFPRRPARTVGRLAQQRFEVFPMKKSPNGKVKLAPALPRAPGGLSAEAKRWWRKIVAEWNLDDAALLLLENAMSAFDRMREAQAAIAADGITVTDRFGQVKQHPATLVERDSKATLLRHLKSLNLDLEPLHDRAGRPPKK
jgi:P27 family predicted phage terminase small subunit